MIYANPNPNKYVCNIKENYLVERQLAGDAEGVAELRLAGAELAEDLGQRAGLDPACGQGRVG